jgi:hypothetical protein
MDMTPALPAFSPSHLGASTRSDLVSEKTASRAAAKIFLSNEILELKWDGAEGSMSADALIRP